MDIDYVIMAVGSKVEDGIIQKNQLLANQNGFVKVDEKYKTNIEGVFAGGDLLGNQSTIAWASRSGRDAARVISEYLK